MWIILTKKLPTAPSPPKLSIFWSVPWPDTKYATHQSVFCQRCGLPDKKKTRTRGLDFCVCAEGPEVITPEDRIIITHYGAEHNWVGARKITYRQVSIRIFPNEFNIVPTETMRFYVFGMGDSGPTHDLVADSVAEERMIQGTLDGETRPIYEMALLDGCTHEQAMMTALGMDITLPDEEFQPLGWYRCRREYAEVFCYDWELTEDHKSESELIQEQR